MWASTAEAPILLIGSAHVVDLEAALRRVLTTRPLDAIALELDDERAAALLQPEPEARRSGAGAPIFLRLWAHLQRRLGAEMGGGIAGAEMRVAATIAQERRLAVLFIDDPIRDTLRRLLGSLSVRERVGLVAGALLGLIIPTRVVEQQLDQYNEAPQPYLEEVRRVYPSIARVLLDERNEHMADRLLEARRKGFGRVAAVVGDAHVPGLADALRRRGIPVDTMALGELVGAPTKP
ncbi:MAG: TraB domain-containing protein [Thermoplasmata archaeon]|nr:TraB domain-containing protein [Thermoplasmata archaeon]